MLEFFLDPNFQIYTFTQTDIINKIYVNCHVLQLFFNEISVQINCKLIIIFNLTKRNVIMY